jgi:hypothetical protein
MDFSWGKKKNNNNNMVTSGVETALLLGSKKRQAVFKKDITSKFPFLPPAVLDACLDALSSSFESVAPSDLKKALQPGGLDKVRPKLESQVIENVKNQDVIKGIPLPNKDKESLVKYVVTLSFDYLLGDAQAALQAPALKLQTLSREQYEIRKFMSFREIVWYRLRYQPIQTVSLTLLIGWSLFLTYRQYQKTTAISTIRNILLQIVGTIHVTTMKLNKLVMKSTSGRKRKVISKSFQRR